MSANEEATLPGRPKEMLKTWAVRAALIALGLAAWFETQAMLGARKPRSSQADLRISAQVLSRGDAMHEWLAPLHRRLEENRHWAHGLLIVSSATIDLLAAFLLGWSIFGKSLRPFVGLLVLFSLRQICQVLSALPPPPGMIWEDPGFPTVLVYYEVTNDLFFSGHTAIAVLGAIELGRYGGAKLRLLAVVIAVFLTATVLVLYAHYTMDVFAGAMTALFAASLSKWLAPYCDRGVARLVAVEAP